MNIQSFSQGKNPAYIATRLFDNYNRYYGALIEKAAFDGFVKALEQLQLKPSGPLTFLPYRDSNESVVASENESLVEAIFRIDCEQLQSAILMIAPIHDLHPDSGVCFEIGFSYARAIPVFLITGNFFHWRFNKMNCSYAADPLIDHMATGVIDAGAFSLKDEEKTREGYLLKLKNHSADMQAQIRTICFDQVLNRVFPPTPFIPEVKKGTVHLEFGGGQFEYQRTMSKLVASSLESLGIPVTISSRFQMNASSKTEFEQGIVQDLEHAAAAEVLISFGDGSDMDPEVAAIQGMRFGLGRKVLLYCTTNKFLYTGEEYNTQRNLMIVHSANAAACTVEELIPLTMEWLDK